MVKIGIIGDIHYPGRCDKIPREFLEWFSKENVDMIIGTGDYNSPEILDEIRKICKNSVLIKGNTDYLDLPREKIVEVEGHKILVFHSDNIYPRGDLQKIYHYSLEKGVDIVIFGHTHTPMFTYIPPIYFLNPGSACGVYSGEIDEVVKSSAILEIDSEKILVKFLRL